MIGPEMNRRVLVVGLGNLIMKDEGIGPRIIEEFKHRQEDFCGVDFVDAGTGGMSLLHIIENREEVIFIDCAEMGMKPGEIKKFEPAEVQSLNNQPSTSLHQADLLKIIGISKQLDQYPGKITIFGIQPEIIAPGRELSETLSSKLPDYIREISAEIKN